MAMANHPKRGSDGVIFIGAAIISFVVLLANLSFLTLIIYSVYKVMAVTLYTLLYSGCCGVT